MDLEAHRDLKLLEAVHEDAHVTQRGLASKLGIALGLANIYLRRLMRKGYIKVANVQPNRLTYLITPRGIAEKARLTYEFMDYSLHLYKEVRQHLREMPCVSGDYSITITASIGVHAIETISFGGIDPLLQLADQALYRAKADGRDCVRTSQSEAA